MSSRLPTLSFWSLYTVEPMTLLARASALGSYLSCAEEVLLIGPRELFVTFRAAEPGFPSGPTAVPLVSLLVPAVPAAPGVALPVVASVPVLVAVGAVLLPGPVGVW